MRPTCRSFALTLAALAVAGCSMSVGALPDVVDDSPVLPRDTVTILPDVQSEPDIVVPVPDGGSNLPLGAPCNQDAECMSGICVQTPGLIPGGCGLPCRNDMGCDVLGTGYNCVVDRAPGVSRLVCAGVEGAINAPTDACAADAECTSNLCVEGTCRNPCIASTECAAGLRCGAYLVETSMLQVCRADPITAPVVEEYVLFDGSTMVDRGTDTFRIVAPPDVVSLTFVARDMAGSELGASVINLQAPDETFLIQGSSWNFLAAQPVREILFQHQINSAQFPSSNTLRPTGGVYQAQFALFNDRSAMTAVRTRQLRGSVRIKRAPMGVVSSGTLHLRIYLVGISANGGPTAASAPTNTRLQNGVRNLGTIYGTMGIRVVVDGYSDITGADATRLAIIDGRPEMNDLLRLSAPSTGDVLNLFLVRGISSSAGLENAIGIAGDIVGPAGVHGTVHSGVLVGWESTINSGNDIIAHTMAHECGHYLGLWHTRENLPPCTAVGQTGCSGFGGVDSITDTPTDNASSSRYLMHWQTNGTNNRLSPGQGTVMLANPLTR